MYSRCILQHITTLELLMMLGVRHFDSPKFHEILVLSIVLWFTKLHWIVYLRPLWFDITNLASSLPSLVCFWTCHWESLTFGWHALALFVVLFKIEALIWASHARLVDCNRYSYGITIRLFGYVFITINSYFLWIAILQNEK